jgi:hypothetical protein
MNAWKILELEPTSDLKAIKKAYARQLKKIDQDTQAILFIQLREAFATAQFQAENMRYAQDDALFENTEIDFSLRQGHQNTRPVHIVLEMDIQKNNAEGNSRYDTETDLFQYHALDRDSNVQTSDQTKMVHQSDNHNHELTYYSDQQQCSPSWLIAELNECFDQLQQAITQQLANFPLQEKIQYFLNLINKLRHEEIQNKYSEKLNELIKNNALEDFLSLTSQDNHFSQFELGNGDFEYIENTEPENLALLTLAEKIKVQFQKRQLDQQLYDQFNLLMLDFDLLSSVEKTLIKQELIVPLVSSKTISNITLYHKFIEQWFRFFPHDLHSSTLSYYESLARTCYYQNIHPEELNQFKENISNRSDDSNINPIHSLSQVIRSLENNDVNDQVFENFTRALHDFDLLTDADTILFKQKFRHALSEVNLTPRIYTYARFLLLWYKKFPKEFHENFIKYKELNTKISYAISKFPNFYFINQEDETEIYYLTKQSNFSPFKANKTYRRLKKIATSPQITHLLESDHFNQSDHNSNYYYIKSRANWYSFLWTTIISLISLYYFFDYFKIEIPIIAYLILSICYFRCIQAPLQSLLSSLRNKPSYNQWIFRFWFLNAIILIYLTEFIIEPIHYLLTQIWLILSILLLGSVQLTLKSHQNKILDADITPTDSWILKYGFIALCLIISFIFFIVGSTEHNWLIYFSLVPTSLIIFNHQFRPIIEFDQSSKKYTLYHLNYLSAEKIIPLIIVIFIYILATTLNERKEIHDYIYINLFIFLCLFFTSMNIKKLSNFYKYLCYVIFILLSIPTVIGPFYFIAELITSAKLQKKLKNNQTTI